MDPDYQEKISHLNDLVKLSQIDGKESHIESNFINSIADRLGIPRVDIDKIKSGDLDIKFQTPKLEKDVIEQYHRLIILMGIDKMIYKEEVRFCFELGVRMGLNTNAIMEVLRKTLRKPAYIMQKDEMEEIFKKYSN
jgi:hypothetical protein